MSQAEIQADSRSLARRKTWGFRLAAVMLAILPFALLELILTACDVGDPGGYDDPFVGFSGVRPLFELDEERDVYEISPSRSLFFGRQEFPREKPANGFRIFCLGGSTVRGRPFETDSSFVQWLELEMQDRDPVRKYEAINCGGLSYASYRLRHVLQEVLQYEPNLVIIATGHNEFLEDRSYAHVKSRSEVRAWVEDRMSSLRTVTLARQLWVDADGKASRGAGDPGEPRKPTVLPEKIETALDNRSGYASYHWDAEWRRGVIEHFSHTLREMVRMCAAAEVPVVFVNLGMNLRDCPPFKSEHTQTLSPAEHLQWQQLFQQASAVEPDEPETALRLYLQAEEISDGYALLLYRIARCLDRLNRSDEARPYYIRAKEFDVCPLRALEEINGHVLDIATETSTPLVNARHLLEEESPGGISGFDWYVDHVHPSPGGHQRIAQALAERLRELEIPERLPKWSPARRREIYRRHWNALGDVFLANGARRVTWLENWAQRNRLLEETLPVTAADFLRLADKYLDFEDAESAWQAQAAAIEIDPDATTVVIEQAAALVGEGRPAAAEKLLDRLGQHTTDHSLQGQIALGRLVIALELDQDAKAAGIYQEHSTALEEVWQTDTPWRALMPDALERVARAKSG